MKETRKPYSPICIKDPSNGDIEVQLAVRDAHAEESDYGTHVLLSMDVIHRMVRHCLRRIDIANGVVVEMFTRENSGLSPGRNKQLRSWSDKFYREQAALEMAAEFLELDSIPSGAERKIIRSIKAAESLIGGLLTDLPNLPAPTDDYDLRHHEQDVAELKG